MTFTIPIQKPFVSAALIAALAFSSAAVYAAAREPAPVIDASAKPATSGLEARVEVLERRLDNQGVMELLTRLDQLQREMQTILGKMEVLNHEMENLKKRQKDLYVDIDRRITQVEQRVAEAGTPPPTSGVAGLSGAVPGSLPPESASTGSPAGVAPAATVASVSPQAKQLQREAYDRAFNLLKDGRYELAIASFKAYLETYPDADYADSAQYWLGEANYAQRRYDVALQEFNKVLDYYPKSAKRPDAMLKMGFSYQELGKLDDAEAVLTNILSMFPDTTAARLAKQRIQDIKRR